MRAIDDGKDGHARSRHRAGADETLPTIPSTGDLMVALSSSCGPVARRLSFLDVRFLRLREAKAILRAFKAASKRGRSILQQHVAGLDRREAFYRHLGDDARNGWGDLHHVGLDVGVVGRGMDAWRTASRRMWRRPRQAERER